MNNTHILIPIKDITEDELKFILALTRGVSKQMSLDEKDIEEKAAEYTKNNIQYYSKSAGMGLHSSYKQALKDILL
jgi:hypothetical protein